ncbi:MAG: T9SS type A sorting domain-containing protein [bacterium]
MAKSFYSQSALKEIVTSFFKNIYSMIHVIFLLTFLASPVIMYAQTVLVHHAGVYEDGNPKYDDDGVQNGIILWGPEKIHVVYHCPFQRATEILKILPGAIVKIAGSVTTDTSGNIVSWSPGGKLYLFNELEGSGGIQIDGATITDIRDDLVGGDTNKDGNASQISPFDFSLPKIIFPKNGNNYLMNSTVKYMEVQFCNTMTIESNYFDRLIRMGIDPFHRPVPYSSPNLSNNIIEFWLNSSSLNLLGLSPIVDGNTFRYAEGVNADITYTDYALNIGELIYTVDQYAFPLAGVTKINNNTFETTNAIYCGGWIQGSGSYSEILFPAEITNNTITGKSKSAELKTGNTAISFKSNFNISIQGNVISNFVTYLNIFNSPNLTECNIHINNNRFNLNPEGFSNNLALGFNINRGSDGSVFPVIDATNNYWGEPSGPKDSSAVDGFWNPRGNGLDFKQAAYINYIPFIGGAAPEDKDDVHITAETIEPLPDNNLVPDYTATIRVTVDRYNLFSASSGKIVVYVQDNAGFYHNLPGAEIPVTPGNTTAGPIDVTFKVPLTAASIDVTAILFPDGDKPTTTSNTVNFKVEQLENRLEIIKIKENTGQNLVEGNNHNLTMEIKYTLTTASPTLNGSLEIDIQRMTWPGCVVRYQFPLITMPAEPASEKKVSQAIPLNIPLLDYSDAKEKIIVVVNLKDENGNVKAQKKEPLDLFPPCQIEEIINTPAMNSGSTVVRTGSFSLMTGEKLILISSVKIVTRLSQTSNLKLILESVEYRDRNDIILTTDHLDYVCVNNIETGTRNYNFNVITDKIIPSLTDAIFMRYKVIEPNQNFKICSDLRLITVENPASISSQPLLTGALEIDFHPVRAKMNVISNTQTGEITAAEVNSPYSSSNKFVKVKSFSEIMFSYWEFIPLNRYWLVYESQPVGDVVGTISFEYDPVDFPANPLFDENTLVIAGLNPYSGELEALNTTLNKGLHMVTANYEKFFQTWVVASLNSGELTGISEPSNNEIPTDYELSQNFPNPFNPTTTIRYAVPTVETGYIPSLQYVTLKIYDILGSEVATLVDEQKSPGYYEVEFDASGFSSGVYFYRIVADNFIGTKKMLLIK